MFFQPPIQSLKIKTPIEHPSPPQKPGRERWLRSFTKTISKWIQNYQSRKVLTQMSRQEIQDIGVTPTEANREAKKGFWEN